MLLESQLAFFFGSAPLRPKCVCEKMEADENKAKHNPEAGSEWTSIEIVVEFR